MPKMPDGKEVPRILLKMMWLVPDNIPMAIAVRNHVDSGETDLATEVVNAHVLSANPTQGMMTM